MVVLGSGPAGKKAAVQAVKLHKKVLIIEKNPHHIGGGSLHTGTIPSKSLRETVVYLERLRQRTYGIDIQLKQNITADALMYRKDHVIDDEEAGFRRILEKNNIELVHGHAHFLRPDQAQALQSTHDCGAENPQSQSDSKPQPPIGLEVVIHEGETLRLNADFVVIATGSRPYQPLWVQLDHESVFDTDSIVHLKELPKKLTVIGAGVIGCEYACIFAKLGIRVNLVSKDYTILKFLDHEMADHLKQRMREQRIVLRFGEDAVKVVRQDRQQLQVHLDSGKVLPCSHVLVATGRSANVEGLELENVGVGLTSRGMIQVDANTYQTAIPNIYAVGDVIGFPALASTSMLQGRMAALHAFDQMAGERFPEHLPFGLWTIPPVAMVGHTERDLTEAKIPYEAGFAHFNEIARARIMGEENGLLKLLFDPDSLKLLGVHIIGPRATELIHLGQSVMYYGGTIRYFMNSVFNYPTLDEAYQVAAFNGFNRLSYDL